MDAGRGLPGRPLGSCRLAPRTGELLISDFWHSGVDRRQHRRLDVLPLRHQLGRWNKAFRAGLARTMSSGSSGSLLAASSQRCHIEGMMYEHTVRGATRRPGHPLRRNGRDEGGHAPPLPQGTPANHASGHLGSCKRGQQ